jgi:molybdopterin synthase sulfur carrier subunit
MTIHVQVQFFARFRETLGTESERLEGTRGGVWEVLAEPNLMCARNQELCQLDEPVEPGDEVAFFPTVTGG